MASIVQRNKSFSVVYTIAVLYSKMRNQENMTPQILSSVHKLLHSAFEQAVLWEYADRNPFHKATLPKAFPCSMEMLSINYCTAHLNKRCFGNTQTAIHFIKLHFQKHFPVQWKCCPTKKSKGYCKTADFRYLGLRSISHLQALCAKGRSWR